MQDLYEEASRQFSVCNACRYCEGFCAVFPAIEERLWIYDRGYIDYIANLCHDCRNCFYSCPYVPPNPFSINIPMLLSSIRLESYSRYTYPQIVSRTLFRKPLLGGLIITLISLVLVYLYAVLTGDPLRLFRRITGPGSFYEIIPYGVIASGGIALLLYIALVLGISSYRYWKSIGGPRSGDVLRAFVRALWDVMIHRYFRGGGEGCSYPGERQVFSRLYLHLSLFIGLALAVLSTITAAIYQEILGILPPYGMLSPPVILGICGGVLMVIGSTGLLYMKARSDKSLINRVMMGLDIYMLVLLNLIAFTGLLTMIFRETSYMGVIFTIHMGLVVALFIIAPYSKIIHILYRYLSLMKYNSSRKAGKNS
jgi:citrate/tricarballylate utilization protein